VNFSAIMKMIIITSEVQCYIIISWREGCVWKVVMSYFCDVSYILWICDYKEGIQLQTGKSI
jgi:hypothetical protein